MILKVDFKPTRIDAAGQWRSVRISLDSPNGKKTATVDVTAQGVVRAEEMGRLPPIELDPQFELDSLVAEALARHLGANLKGLRIGPPTRTGKVFAFEITRKRLSIFG